MKKIDDSYEVKLNFIDEFNLSRNGMLNEIKTEFDIIRCVFKNKVDWTKHTNQCLIEY